MDFSAFKAEIKRQLGLDLEAYKEQQLKRRLDSFLTYRGIAGYHDYLQLILKDQNERQRLINRITINVSEFFRNPEVFTRLGQEVLPEMLGKTSTLKIWSAACASGAEPYSVAIMLDELTPGRSHRLEATDIDESMIIQSKEAVYRQDLLRNVSPERLRCYFNQQDNGYQVIEKLRRQVNFRRHDLLSDPFATGYNLIICRNVVIYFTRETQEKLYEQFVQALAPGGVLLVGATETIWNCQSLGLVKLAPWFYQRQAGT